MTENQGFEWISVQRFGLGARGRPVCASVTSCRRRCRVGSGHCFCALGTDVPIREKMGGIFGQKVERVAWLWVDVC